MLRLLNQSQNVIKTIRDRKGDIMTEFKVKIITAAISAAALAVCCTINSDLGKEVYKLCDFSHHDI